MDVPIAAVSNLVLNMVDFIPTISDLVPPTADFIQAFTDYIPTFAAAKNEEIKNTTEAGTDNRKHCLFILIFVRFTDFFPVSYHQSKGTA
jgi:hypothetical protein